MIEQTLTATGTFTALASRHVSAVHVRNLSGADLEVRRTVSAADATMKAVIPDKGFQAFDVRNAAELEVLGAGTFSVVYV